MEGLMICEHYEPSGMLLGWSSHSLRLLRQSDSQANDQRKKRQEHGKECQQENIALHAQVLLVWRHCSVEPFLERWFCGLSGRISIIRAIRVLPFGYLHLLVHYRLRVSVTRHLACVAGGRCCLIEKWPAYV